MKNKKCLSALMGLIFLLMFSLPVYAEDIEKINVPEGYVNGSTKITVTTAENDDKELVSIKVKSGNTYYGDITSRKYFLVSGNCEVDVEVKYRTKDGEEEVKHLTAKIDRFDGSKPTVSASILGDTLTIKAEDDLSGVSIINVNNKDYPDLTEGAVGINIKELEHTGEYLTVFAKDNAGNISSTYKIKNPYYVGETENRQDQSADNPQSTEPSSPSSSVATVTSHTDDEGRDLSSSVDNTDSEPMVEQPKTSNNTVENATVSNKKAGGKEFYTIKTDSDKIFYLVIDETDTNESAYLLTEVDDNDLLNFVNYDGEAVKNGEITVYSIAEDKSVIDDKPEEVEEEEVESKEVTKRSPIGIMIVVIIGVIAFYIIKVKGKLKEDKSDSDDYDDDFDMNETIDEDKE